MTKLVTAFTGPSRDGVPGFLSTGHFGGSINPFIAGLAEDHVPGSDLGPLFHTILVNQFTRLRDGDRFFHLNYIFTPAESSLIGAADTLGEVIKANTSITNLQNDVFRHLSQENGQGKGFYTTTNGQTALTGSPTGTKLTDSLFDGLVAALTNPNQPGRLVLVDANGNSLSRNFLKTYSNVKSYLETTDGSAAFKLSQQLLVAEINVLLGKVDATTSIFVPAITVSGQPISSTLHSSLKDNGVSNPSGIANIQAILDAAIAQLRTGSSDNTFEEALKDCLDAINNNQAIFILN